MPIQCGVRLAHLRRREGSAASERRRTRNGLIPAAQATAVPPPAVTVAMVPAAPIHVLRGRCLLGDQVQCVNVPVDGCAGVSSTKHHRGSNNCYPQCRSHFRRLLGFWRRLDAGSDYSERLSSISIRIRKVRCFRMRDAIGLRSCRHERNKFVSRSRFTNEAIREISARGRNLGGANNSSGGHRNNRRCRMDRLHMSKNQNDIRNEVRGANSLYANRRCAYDRF